ncbi:MAG: energy-coupling factor transporter transmembrane component T family protein [Candidatus Heritagella sp.]
MGNILEFVPGHSFLHRLNPITKIVLAFLFSIASLLSNNLFIQLGLLLLLLGVAFFSGIGSKAVGLLRTLLLFCILMVILQLAFMRGGTGYLIVPGTDFPLVTSDGLYYAALFTLRIINATLPLLMMFAITQMNDLTNAMVNKLHVPYRYMFILTTAFRFIPILAGEFHDIMDAQKARGVEFDTRNLVKKVGLIVPLCVPLLISSVKKVDSGAVSAQVRGFSLRARGAGYKEYPFRLGDLLALLVMIGLIVLLVLVG